MKSGQKDNPTYMMGLSKSGREALHLIRTRGNYVGELLSKYKQNSK